MSNVPDFYHIRIETYGSQVNELFVRNPLLYVCMNK